VFFAWRCEAEPAARAQQELESFFERSQAQKKKKERRAARRKRGRQVGKPHSPNADATVVTPGSSSNSGSGNNNGGEAQADRSRSADGGGGRSETCFERGLCSYEELEARIAACPPLAALCPSLLCTCRRAAMKQRAATGWMSVDEYQARAMAPR
jgi:hypothetical protein